MLFARQRLSQMRLSAATILYAIQTFLSFVKSSGHIFSKIYLASKQVQLFAHTCPAPLGAAGAHNWHNDDFWNTL